MKHYNVNPLSEIGKENRSWTQPNHKWLSVI